MTKSLLLLLLITASLPLSLWAQQVTRIEPPHWWIGMKDREVQLMLYGPDISSCTLTSDDIGIFIGEHHRVTNPNYLFVDIQILPNTRPGNIWFNLLKEGNPTGRISYPVFERKPDSALRESYSSEDVIYLITPDRFANGDTTNDHVDGMREGTNRKEPNGRHGGDLAGIHRQLPYFSDMGYTALWLMPVLENDMPKASYHGYAITDYYKVDPRFGTNEDFKQLTRDADSFGIKMIMDLVLNHCGLHHWWMEDLPDSNWINHTGQPYTQTNHRKTLHADPYATKEDMEIMEAGWFVPTMPDLNLRHKILLNYLINNTLWWIEEAGIHGIRMDTYPYPDHDAMSQWAKRIRHEYPNFIITGEVWYEEPAILSFWEDKPDHSNDYDSNLPSLFDFPVQYTLVKALNEPESWNAGWIALYETIAQDFLYQNPHQLCVFPDNHDMSRIHTQLGESLWKTKTALAFILTCRGIPQLFYGTEVLMSHPGTSEHTIIRSDFPGGWNGDTKNGFTGQGLTSEEKEINSFLKNLLQWRKQQPAIHHGSTRHYAPRQGIYVYFRELDHDKIMVVLNKNEEPVKLTLDRMTSELESYKGATEIISGRKISFQRDLDLPAPGPYIFQLSK